MKRSRKWLTALAIVFVLVAIIAAASASVPGIKVSSPDISALRDGVYEGSYFIPPVKVRVAVKVAAGRIEQIELLQHFNGQGKPAEALIPLVVERQSLDVDVVAGATWSSKTILKAIESALRKGPRG